MSSAQQTKKLILVIGATGAQGRAVIDALLAPGANGTESPYSVRALTRQPRSKHAQDLKRRGVEIIEGSFIDVKTVKTALEGVYGAWVNTDTNAVGEQAEVFIGMRIFEIAKQVGTVRHYVWSNLDPVSKLTGYNPDYRAEHYDAKGRVGEWLQAQPSDASNNGMSWTAVSTGPYMDMLNIFMFGPINVRQDGTYVFATPVGNGHVPMIALSDLGWWARYTFDHREETSAQNLKISSDLVGWEYLRETFENVTGKKAVVIYQSVSEWFGNLEGPLDEPMARDLRKASATDATTWRQNFSAFWRLYRDDILKRDYEWIRSVHPGTRTLSQWMKETGYSGEYSNFFQDSGLPEITRSIQADNL